MVREEDAAVLVVVAHQGLAVLGYDPVITAENSVWLMRHAALMLRGFGIGIGRETTEEGDSRT